MEGNGTESTPGLSQKKKLPLKVTKSVKPLVHGADHSFWHKFQFPQLFQQFAGVTHIDFSPVSPHHLAIASSTRVQVYHGTTSELDKSFTKFKDIAYSPKFRSDGKLVAAGGEQPLAKIFDYETKSLLREFKGHQKSVHSVAFGGDRVHLASGSDDNTVKYWDISTGQDVVTFKDHTDYVRTITGDSHHAEQETNQQLIASGSYDHTIKLWDVRENKHVLSIDHGSPVEQILMFPKGTLLVSAGGSVVKIWDLLSGGKLLHTMENHQKTVTSLCLTRDCSRLLSGGIDQIVKVYDMQDYSVVSTLSYPAPILSLAISPDSMRLAVGMADGMLSLKTKANFSAKAHEQEKKKKKFHIPVGIETTIMRQKRATRLSSYEKSLSAYKWKESLDLALEANDETIVFSMISELARRGGLKKALLGRDDKTLLPILRFVNHQFKRTHFYSEVLDVAHLIIGLYSGVIGQSPIIDEQLRTLKRTVESQINSQQALLELMGSLDLVLAAKQ